MQVSPNIYDLLTETKLANYKIKKWFPSEFLTLILIRCINSTRARILYLKTTDSSNFDVIGAKYIHTNKYAANNSQIILNCMYIISSEPKKLNKIFNYNSDCSAVYYPAFV